MTPAQIIVIAANLAANWLDMQPVQPMSFIDHLLPLHVCLGMIGKPNKVAFDDQILGKRGVGSVIAVEEFNQLVKHIRQKKLCHTCLCHQWLLQ